jgi:hypothetical protein
MTLQMILCCEHLWAIRACDHGSSCMYAIVAQHIVLSFEPDVTNNTFESTHSINCWNVAAAVLLKC